MSSERDVLDLQGERTPIASLLRGVHRQRHLLPMLARQDFKGRYRSASLGVLWSVFLPLLQGAVLAVVFTRIVRIETDGPYPVFVIAGIVTWAYFKETLSAGATSIVSSGALASKIYFPRLVLPLVPAAANAVSFTISMVAVLALMVVFDVPFGASLLLLPVAMLLAGVLAVSMGASLAVLHVYARDTRYVVEAGLLVAFYATPVIYPLELAGRFQPILIANPVTGLLQLVRWCVFGEVSGGVAAPLASTAAWTICLIVLTLFVYRRHERVALDRL